MCGRITFTFSKGELASYLKQQYHIEQLPIDIDLPRYNVAPGQAIISVINDGKNNRVGQLKWGFVPPFDLSHQVGFKIINAKAETLFQKQSFKEAVHQRRCVVLADSFYEWDQAKQPYRIFTKGQQIFPLAGIWQSSKRANGDIVHRVAIITTTANKPMARIHERMPVILDEQAQKKWLDMRIQNDRELQQILKPYDDDQIDMYPVSKYVNSVSHDDAQCIKKQAVYDLFSMNDEDNI